MWRYMIRMTWGLGLASALWVWALTPVQAQSSSNGRLNIVATVPGLGSLVREIGGDQVAVTVLAKGTEDPHFVEAKPSFVKILSRADAFVQIGMGMEIGWAPTLLQQARNRRIVPGAPGYIDASTAISPLQVASGMVDRSMGDVHPEGNPHYLLDPVQSLAVTQLIRDRLSALRPSQKADFEARYTAFYQRIGAGLVGEALAAKYDVAKLALLADHGQLDAFLASQGELELLGGWLGRLRAYQGTQVVVDHNQWIYFTQRFGLAVTGRMEPKPGLPPTTRHLRTLIKTMQSQDVKLILLGAYFDPRHARFLAKHTDAKVVNMAHQVGARPEADTYVHMVDYNIQQIQTALMPSQ
ncbi:metal ABC transporter substrate-binding protein [Candidatus Entotheonella palauensis]|uniref:metal ABC transporter substrate-binding protein n=1 Tax=Candidatus Entotheonella palauensis TaxID=93172 RepID=UPI000B7CC6A1|nr:metal ABC transporter substrate-binding protein [Candidatus Entotheonella palauensis]